MDSYPQGEQACSLLNSASWIWGRWFTVTRLSRTRATGQGFVPQSAMAEGKDRDYFGLRHTHDRVFAYDRGLLRTLQFTSQQYDATSRLDNMLFSWSFGVLLVCVILQWTPFSASAFLLSEWYFCVNAVGWNGHAVHKRQQGNAVTRLPSRNLQENTCTKEANSTRR